MIKLIAMDVDNTIAQLNRPVLDHDLNRIKKFEDNGVRIMLISGKPTSYLTGLARQLGLNNILLSGENGVVINQGHDYPPKKVYKNFISKKQFELLKRIKELLDIKFGDYIWYQPNEVQITAFNYDQNDLKIKSELDNYVEELFTQEKYLEELKYYIHSDCVDITAKQISKGSCLKMYMEKTGLLPEEVVTIGDGVNDISMFRISGTSISIGDIKDFETTHKFKTIHEALVFLED